MVHVLYSPSLDPFVKDDAGEPVVIDKASPTEAECRRRSCEWADFLDALFYERPSHAFYPLTSEQFETVH